MTIAVYSVLDIFPPRNMRSYREFSWPTNADDRNVPCWTLAGYQRVVKGHYRGSAGGSSGGVESQYVVIFLALFRLEDQKTDIVVSLNYPVRQPAEVEAILNPDTNVLLRWLDMAPGLCDAQNTLREIIANFEIIDWSLFDDDGEEE